MRDRAVWLV